MSTYRFQRGETITLGLEATSGDVASVTSVTGRMARFIGGTDAADFDVAPATGFDGWLLTIPAAASAELAPGEYRADAKLTIAGGVAITEAVQIRIDQAASSPA